MPRLNLISKDDFDLTGVFAVGVEERLQDVVDRQGDLGTEWADVVHYRDASPTMRSCGVVIIG